MEQQNKNPSAGFIMQMGTGFWVSKILLSAVKFQLFTKLSGKKLISASQIKSMLNLKVWAISTSCGRSGQMKS